ncbi:hypothetical protein D5E78_05350 [Vibrio parahaemolyticus]|nr:hypothetical protein D5E78_05350 [Vibrio parahaemolyticus]
MKITGKHIRSISKILALTKGKDVIRLGYKLKSSDSDKILSLGFFKPFTESGYIVPSPVSKLTLRNANGHMVTRKDLPKETREIEYYSSNKDWHGGYHEGVRFKEILAYPKEFISPNLEEFVIKEIEGDEFFVSNGIDISFDKDRLKFVANLMLELFGEFEIITEDFSTTSNCKHKNVSWDILPPGDYPWNKISEIVSKGMSLKK